jgi:O-antigen/teichoic acid export membrane protein
MTTQAATPSSGTSSPTGTKVEPAHAHPRVLRNATAQIGGRVLYLLTRVALPPFILHHLSLQEYGIWATCFLLIGYIGMSTFGIAGVYIRYSAEFYARGEIDRIGRMVGAGIMLTGILGGVLMAGVHFSMPIIFRWFHIGAELQEIAHLSILSVIGALLLELLLPYTYVLQGIHRNAEQTAVTVMSFLLETALIVVFLMQGWGLKGLLAAYVLRALFAMLVLLFWFPRILPGLRIRFRGVGRDEFRLFFRYGSTLQFIGIIAMFLNTCERAIAGYATKGVGSVGLMDIGQKFPVMISQTFNAATNTYLSAFTHLHSLDRHGELQQLYLKASRYLNLLNGLAMGFLAPFAMAVITVWIGDKVPSQEAGTILLYAALGFHMQAVTGPATTYAQATHRVGTTFWWFLLPQSLLLAGLLGWYAFQEDLSVLNVARAAMEARMASSVLVILHTLSTLRISTWLFVKDVALIGMLPYAVGYAVAYAVAYRIDLLALPRLDALLALAIIASTYLVVAIALLLGLMSTREERQTLKSLARRMLPGRP